MTVPYGPKAQSLATKARCSTVIHVCCMCPLTMIGPWLQHGAGRAWALTSSTVAHPLHREGRAWGTHLAQLQLSHYAGKVGFKQLACPVSVLSLGWLGQAQSGQPDRLWLGCYEERVGPRVTSPTVAHSTGNAEIGHLPHWFWLSSYTGWVGLRV